MLWLEASFVVLSVFDILSSRHHVHRRKIWNDGMHKYMGVPKVAHLKKKKSFKNKNEKDDKFYKWLNSNELQYSFRTGNYILKSNFKFFT